MTPSTLLPGPATGSDRIDERNGLIAVRLAGDAREVAWLYRELAVRLLETEASGVLVLSGSASPEGHVVLWDVLETVRHHGGIRSTFRIAVVPETPRARWVFTQIQLPFRNAGIAMEIFDSETAARAWLATPR